MRRFFILWIFVAVLAQHTLVAQPSTGPVPDVTGMTIAAATAVLNASGFSVGAQYSVPAAEGQRRDAITGQMPAPGTYAEVGSSIDLIVARKPNARLIYDNNDLTLVNLSEEPLPLGTLVFAGDGGAVFRGDRWGRTLSEGECVQIWSVTRSKPKGVEGCVRIVSWLTTNDTTQHVWTQGSGERFTIFSGNQPQAECMTAQRGTQNSPAACEFYAPSAASGPYIPYIYLAYTTDGLVVRNPSETTWLRLSNEIVTATGKAIRLQQASQYDSVSSFVLTTSDNGTPQVRQLAPSQCVRFRAVGAPDDAYPEPCSLVADRVTDEPFWQTAFSVRSRDGKAHACDPAVPGRVVVCVAPR